MKYLKKEEVEKICGDNATINENLYYILDKTVNHYKDEISKITCEDFDFNNLIEKMNKTLSLYRMISYKKFDVNYIDTVNEPSGITELKSLVAIAKMFKEVNG